MSKHSIDHTLLSLMDRLDTLSQRITDATERLARLESERNAREAQKRDEVVAELEALVKRQTRPRAPRGCMYDSFQETCGVCGHPEFCPAFGDRV